MPSRKISEAFPLPPKWGKLSVQYCYGTKGEVYVCDVGHPISIIGALDEDATATLRCIARDGAVGNGDSSDEVEGAAAKSPSIVRDGAVAQRERAVVGDATTAKGS